MAVNFKSSPPCISKISSVSSMSSPMLFPCKRGNDFTITAPCLPAEHCSVHAGPRQTVMEKNRRSGEKDKDGGPGRSRTSTKSCQGLHQTLQATPIGQLVLCQTEVKTLFPCWLLVGAQLQVDLWQTGLKNGSWLFVWQCSMLVRAQHLVYLQTRKGNSQQFLTFAYICKLAHYETSFLNIGQDLWKEVALTVCDKSVQNIFLLYTRESSKMIGYS